MTRLLDRATGSRDRCTNSGESSKSGMFEVQFRTRVCHDLSHAELWVIVKIREAANNAHGAGRALPARTGRPRMVLASW